MKQYLIAMERRPCCVFGRKAIFHCWFPEFYERNKTQRSDLWGIVEYEDGTIHKVSCRNIVFMDSREEFESVAWPEPEDEQHD